MAPCHSAQGCEGPGLTWGRESVERGGLAWGELRTLRAVEVALGGNDCPGPREPLVQGPLEESGTCRRSDCSRLAATEALSPWPKGCGGKVRGERGAQEDVLATGTSR